MIAPDSTRERGQQAETHALNYLLQQDLTLITRNYHANGGEIDLIMQEHDAVIFVEVRYRKNNLHHAAIESIDPKKCQRIINTSYRFLQANRRMTRLDCRFDVIVLSGPLANPTVEWIKDAFQA